VTAGEECHEDFLDDWFLSNNSLRDFFAQPCGGAEQLFAGAQGFRRDRL
jgi:hypothetical protein